MLKVEGRWEVAYNRLFEGVIWKSDLIKGVPSEGYPQRLGWIHKTECRIWMGRKQGPIKEQRHESKNEREWMNEWMNEWVDELSLHTKWFFVPFALRRSGAAHYFLLSPCPPPNGRQFWITNASWMSPHTLFESRFHHWHLPGPDLRSNSCNPHHNSMAYVLLLIPIVQRGESRDWKCK